MPDFTIVTPMTDVEARASIIAMQGGFVQIQRLALDFDRRLGWQALGYPTLASCFESELGYSMQHGYRLMAAAQVNENLNRLSPQGETPPVLREKWVRESGLAKLEPEEQVEAVRLGNQLAQSEQAAPTTRHYAEAVREVQARKTVFQSPYYVVTHMVVTGLITAQAGLDMNAALEKLKPQQRGVAVQALAQYGITCPALLMPVTEVLSRPESKLYPEVKSGYLAGTPLKSATMSDWKRAAAEAQRQHLAEIEEQKRQDDLAAGKLVVVDVVLSLPTGDWSRCVEVLRRELGDSGFESLSRAMMAQ